MKYLLQGILLILLLSTTESQAHSRPPRAIRVSFEYLEACEVGPKCEPINVSRKAGEKLELVLPNLSRTSVTIWDEENYSKLMKRADTYEPIQRTGSSKMGKRQEIVLPLRKMKDGIYYVWVVGDSVGGIFQIHLKTE